MTWKAGDSVSVSVYTESAAGVPQTYVNWTAFLAAGWTATFFLGSVALSTQPTVVLAPVPGNPGWHSLTFLLPVGVNHILVTPPTGYRSDPADLTLITPSADTDSLASSIVAALGGPTNSSGFQTFDFSSIEGDNFPPQVFTIPTAALQVLDASGIVFQYADMSDIGGQPWTIAASARGNWAAGQLPSNSVAFSYLAVITSKINRQVAISFPASVPAGAVVVNSDGTADTTGASASSVYKYDIQIIPPTGSTYAGRKLTVVAGNHTIYRQQTTSP